jgi:hypothetical protein
MCTHVGMRKTLRLGLGLASLVVGLAACSGSEAPVASADDDLKTPATAKQIEELFRAVDDNCAANGTGNGGVSKFDVAKFSAAAAIERMRAEDKDASGVKLFEDHINDKNEDTKSCLKENLTAAQRTRLKQVVSDAANVGVFASVYSGGDNPEGCSYYNFHVYRRDGTLLELTFNFTD